jgi:ribosome-associated protein|tara:strand:+ start:28 stop:378 length:351 start_codon:yes stop_codon:yes gene_type:complete
MEKVLYLKKTIEQILNDNKAIDVNSVNLKDKSSVADYMIVASGTSSRHLQALSEMILKKLKKEGISNCHLEGKDSNEWKLVDGIDIIVHIFSPEKRKFYNLEKMWAELLPKERLMI